MDPITPEFLEDPTNSAYFQIAEPSQEYNNFRQFGLSARRYCFNKVLSLVRKISDNISFLDIGAGRGINYHLAISNSFNTVISYEPDV